MSTLIVLGKGLRAVLILRVAASLLFVVWLNNTTPSATALVAPLVWFAAIDGALSVMMAVLGLGIVALRGWFVTVAALDGLWLIAAATVIWFEPRTPDLVLTLVLYIALAAMAVLSLSLLRLADARRQASPRDAVRTALLIAAIAGAFFGIGAYFLRPHPVLVRWLLMTAAATEGLALLAVAVRRILPVAGPTAGAAFPPQPHNR
jgi:hypothetical protein